MAANLIDNKKWMTPISVAWLSCLCQRIFRESHKGLRGSNIKVAHKPICFISSILKKPKDKIEKEASRGIVYKIKFKDCDCVYVGQTSRALKTRVKELTKAIETLHKNASLAKHHMLHNHQIDSESVEIVDRSLAWRRRLILEAWHSMRDRNVFNEHITLPNIYNNIKNF